MPSPVGHALGGLIAGWLLAGRGAPATAASQSLAFAWRRTALFGGLALAPDLDLFFGTHSTYTHSVGAVLIVAFAALIVTRGRRPLLALACAAAWGSHLVLDWLGADSTPPLGIMALWPFTNDFYQSPQSVFMAISRRYWLPEFYAYNLRAVLREIVILGPAAWLSWSWTARRARNA